MEIRDRAPVEHPPEEGTPGLSSARRDGRAGRTPHSRRPRPQSIPPVLGPAGDHQRESRGSEPREGFPGCHPVLDRMGADPGVRRVREDIDRHYPKLADAGYEITSEE